MGFAITINRGRGCIRAPERHQPPAGDVQEQQKRGNTLASDRRKVPRYHVEESAIIIYDQATDREIGVVTDISLKGLAFEYFDVGAPIPGKGELNLLVWDYDFYIRKLPYRIVSNFLIQTREHTPIPIARCSVEFYDLSSEKQEELQSFIKFFSGETEDFPDNK